MKIATYLPKDSRLQKYIAYYYETTLEDIDYYAYPHYNLPCSIMQHAFVNANDYSTIVSEATGAKGGVYVFNRFKKPIQIIVEGKVKEFCIVFKPYGLAQFKEEPLPIVTDKQAEVFSIFTDFFTLNPTFLKAGMDTKIDILDAYLFGKLSEKPGTEIMIKAFSILETENVSISDLAVQCCCSAKKLSRLFYKLCGESAVTFKQIVIFRKALEQLQAEHKSVSLSDIAFLQGYCDVSYFSNSFKRLTGETPGNFFKNVSSYSNQHIYFKKVKKR
ncbi:helix-turn-helix domain-containing protein [Neptunitalea lumnitzerae]|uniref:HTH araC/xylS-type domain-containing protein n=1 Tax=Neptunitalea lumnitzerae TaxID=2965509 RepID=A0ABQ5MGA3_9FLAO|nr:AraC family transcriptional regulator [Neptunitalea sp. Y10]GLB47937.1 hypothetical protein Y10_03050 [Neptunitalea sp. Y10]